MFKNKFQGGPYVEVFSCQGRNPALEWKLQGAPSAIRKEFDKEMKGYVFVLEGNSSTIKMTLPKDERHNLGLIQRYLVFQIYVEAGRGFAIDLGVSDMSQVRRHIFLSSSNKEATTTPLHARIPLVSLKRGQWVNFCLDLVSLTGNAFQGVTFHTVDQITISAICKVRKIFTLKQQPPQGDLDDGGDGESEELSEPIPRSLLITTGDITAVTQILRLSEALLSGRRERGKPSSASSVSSRTSRQQKSATGVKKKTHSAGRGKVRTLHQEDTSHPEIVSWEPKPIIGAHSKASANKRNEDVQHAKNEEENCVYSYVSPPHSAKHRSGSQPPEVEPMIFPADHQVFPTVDDDYDLNSSRGTDPMSRGAAYDEDFLNEDEEDDVVLDRLIRADTKRSSHVVSRMNERQTEEVHEVQENKHLDVIPREMRLSDDYDWRDYQSSGSPDSPSSFTGRLPGKIGLLEDSIEDVIIDDDGGESLASSSDGGLTLGMEASVEWQLGASQSLSMASRSGPLNARAMGGLVSPPLVLPTERVDAEDGSVSESSLVAEDGPDGGNETTDGEEELDLLYDPCLNCYYDPTTHKYYELA